MVYLFDEIRKPYILFCVTSNMGKLCPECNVGNIDVFYGRDINKDGLDEDKLYWLCNGESCGKVFNSKMEILYSGAVFDLK